MKIISISKSPFSVATYDNVTNISVNTTTNVITISYGTSGTATVNLDTYRIMVV